MNCKLPAPDYKKRWLWAATGYTMFCLLYTLTGNLFLRPPVNLAPSRLDDLIPFLGWTIWLYHSQSFFLMLCLYTIKRAENWNQVFYSMALASLLSFCIFIIYPTTVPRVVQTNDGLTAEAFAFLYAVDSTANCFPSLHVSLACLAASVVSGERRNLRVLVIIWAFLIILSTMTTKQHYFIDLIGGLAVAIICRIVVSKFV